MAIPRLTESKIAKLVKAGTPKNKKGRPTKRRIGAGNNLCLELQGHSASFYFRWEDRKTGIDSFLPLGPWPAISLEKAQQEAVKHKGVVLARKDPRLERKTERDEERRKRDLAKTVREVGDEWFAHMQQRFPPKPGGTSKYMPDLARILRRDIYPYIGDMLIERVDRPLMLARTPLKKLWFDTKYRGTRMQQVLNQIFNWGISHGYYTKPLNPAKYDEALEKILPENLHPVEKHRGLPDAELSTFMAKLRGYRYGATFSKKMDLPRDHRPVITLMVEFAILNGCRIGEARKARWGEIDFRQDVWRVPKDHLKNGALYENSPGLTRPLTPEMLAILEEVGRHSNRAPDAPVFRPTGSPGKPGTELFSETSLNCFWKNSFKWKGTAFDQHGFRTGIEDWRRSRAVEFAEEWIDIQTDHPPKGKRKRSYYENTNLKERRTMMEAWCQYCALPAPPMEAEPLPVRPCQKCGKPISPEKPRQAQYCSPKCRHDAGVVKRYDRIRASNRASYQRHREKRLAEKRAYWREHKDEIQAAKRRLKAKSVIQQGI
jgi:integrase